MGLILTLLMLSAPAGVPDVLYQCQKVAMAKDMNVSGSYTFRVRTNEKGRVVTVALMKDTVHSDVMERCLRTRLLALTLKEKGRTVKLELNVPRWNRQHSVWLNDVPMVRTVASRVMVRPLLHDSNTGMDTPRLAVVKLLSGSRLPAHFHAKSDVFLYVLDGTVTLYWDRGKGRVKHRDVPKGGAAFVPKGASHEMRASKDAIVAIFFTSPQGFEWLRGNPSSHTRVLPPPGVPMTGPRPDPRAGRKVRVKTSAPKGASRRVTVLGSGGWVLQLVKGKAGNSLKLKGKSVSAFVLQGVGTIEADGDDPEPVHGGSGVAFGSRALMKSLRNDLPFTLVVLSRGTVKVTPLRSRRKR